MWLFQCLLVSVYCLTATLCQHCDIPTRFDLLGSSDIGLLSFVLASTQDQFTGAISSSASPQVQLHDFSVVCLAVAPVLGTYRSASLVANVSCSGVELCLSNASQTLQLELECVSVSTNLSVWGPRAFTGAGGEASLISPADASLDTAVRVDCSSCLSPQDPLTTSDPTTHCVGEL